MGQSNSLGIVCLEGGLQTERQAWPTNLWQSPYLSHYMLSHAQSKQGGVSPQPFAFHQNIKHCTVHACNLLLVCFQIKDMLSSSHDMKVDVNNYILTADFIHIIWSFMSNHTIGAVKGHKCYDTLYKAFAAPFCEMMPAQVCYLECLHLARHCHAMGRSINTRQGSVHLPLPEDSC